MNEIASRYQGYLVGQLLVSLIAIAMVVFGDFGGYYYRTSSIEVTGWVYLGSGVLGTLLIILLIAGLGLASYAIVSSLRDDDITLEILLENTQRATRGAVFTAAIAVIGGVVFVLLNLDSDDWWLDAGFYGALIGGALVAYLGKLVREDIEKELGFETADEGAPPSSIVDSSGKRPPVNVEEGLESAETVYRDGGVILQPTEAENKSAPWPFDDYRTFSSTAEQDTFQYGVLVGWMAGFIGLNIGGGFGGFVALVGILASVVCMYFDCHYLRLETRWHPRPILFALGTLFISIVVIPYYLYRRYKTMGRF